MLKNMEIILKIQTVDTRSASKKKGTGCKLYPVPLTVYMTMRSEHLWLVVLLWSFRSVTTVTAWTSWASVVAAWATVVVTTWTAVVTTVVVTAWASVSAWLALRLHIALRLLDESLA